MRVILREGRLGAGRIAARRFDFDNVHPEIMQQLAADAPIDEVKSRTRNPGSSEFELSISLMVALFIETI